jgi:hypothetical protein
MTVWQADFYRRPLKDEGHPLWELLVCTSDASFRYSAFCAQPEANSTWLKAQLETAIAQAGVAPERIQVFRPQCLSLLQAACDPLQIPVEPTRQTPALKDWLRERAEAYPQDPNYSHDSYEPVRLEQPPPNPLPDNLLGDQWRFAAIAAGDLERVFLHEPMPFLNMPETLRPLSLGIASTTMIPGVVVYGGRRSLPLGQWVQDQHPVGLNYIPGSPDGLVLESGLVERWVFVTFEDAEVRAAAQLYAQRKVASQGLHFLLVQPDDSGMTYTGLWLLQHLPES